MLLCFLTSLYFLIEDQFLKSGTSADSIAQVIYKSKTVKTKKIFNYHWINTKDGDQLQANDQVFTYDDSNAKIILKSGSKISVSPNTLISLNQLENDNSINVEKGIILADLNEETKALKININGKEVSLRSKQAKLQISSTAGESRIDIVSGNATFKIDNIQKTLMPGQQITSNNKDIAIKDISLLIKTPSIDQIVLEDQPIQFSWKSKDKVQFEISNDMNFKQILKSYDLTVNNISLKLKSSIYYWRIKTSNEVSTPRVLNVYPNVTTKLISPSNEILLIKQSDGKKISLNWNDKYYKKFELSVKGPNKDLSKTINGSSYILDLSQNGEYFWKVKPISKNNHSWSNENSFTLSQPFLPSAPRVITPKANELISLFDESKFIFRWTGNNKSNYLVSISRDLQESLPIFTKSIRGNLLNWTPKESGVYFFKVKEIDRLDRETAHSKIIKTTFDIIDTTNFLPQSGSKISLVRPKEEVKFKWKKSIRTNKLRPKYYLEISRDNDFKKILISKQSFTNSSKVIFPKIGNYFWRTRVVYPNNKESFSTPQRVTITPTPAPKKPKTKDLDIEIKVNSILKSIKKFISNIISLFIPSTHASEINTSAKIEWDKIDNTKVYILEVFEDRELRNIILKKEIKENHYNISNIKEGTYYWRIAVIDHWNRQSEFSEASKLNFKLPTKYKKVSRPNLRFPENSFRYNTKKALIKFRWNDVKDAKKYIILISKDKKFKNIYVKRTKESNKLNIRLSQSKYYWKVTAINQFNYSAQSKIRTFTIKQKPRKKQKTIHKKVSKKVIRHIPKSQIYFQYDISSSNLEQQFQTYEVNASDLVFTSIEFGNSHLINLKSSLESRVKIISGKVFEDLDYGLLSFESMYFREIISKDLTIGAGVSFNKYTSYIRTNSAIEDKSNSSLSLPIGVNYSFFIKEFKNNLSLKYSFGSLSMIEIGHSINIWKNFSVGLLYENYSTTIDNSNLTLSNIKASLKYHINY
jgi:hypothetical protein